MKVEIYTDGGADPNPGVGGWAAILRANDQEKVLTGNSPSTTNNRMELQAAVSALKALTRPVQVEFHTDSEYLRKGITEWIEKWEANNWKIKGKPVANADLWKQLRHVSEEHDIEWFWVKGHSGDPLNERVDRLARSAREEIISQQTLSLNIPSLYVRGSCKGNPGPGGWGVVLEIDDETEQLSGSSPKTTNNRMELLAVIEGLKLLPQGSDVNVITASDYLYMGATKWIHGWRRRNWTKRDGKPISNRDLWQSIDRLMNQYKIRWVSGKGIPDHLALGLEEAGQLATLAVEFEL